MLVDEAVLHSGSLAKYRAAFFRTSFRADWRVRPQSDLFAGQTALLQADLFAAATGATAYAADTYIPRVTEEQLRAASSDYPENIRLRYLRLPGDLPARVRELAKEITNGTSNPYDKARAIESYLRNNYLYDLAIPVPPPDQDVTDYFLFDLQRGYCDYYATAMVVLARIDDRLIHGQVVEGWVNYLKATWVIVADDAVALIGM